MKTHACDELLQSWVNVCWIWGKKRKKVRPSFRPFAIGILSAPCTEYMYSTPSHFEKKKTSERVRNIRLIYAVLGFAVSGRTSGFMYFPTVVRLEGTTPTKSSKAGKI